jgi:hypothetical protein
MLSSEIGRLSKLGKLSAAYVLVYVLFTNKYKYSKINSLWWQTWGCPSDRAWSLDTIRCVASPIHCRLTLSTFWKSHIPFFPITDMISLHQNEFTSTLPSKIGRLTALSELQNSITLTITANIHITSFSIALRQWVDWEHSFRDWTIGKLEYVIIVGHVAVLDIPLAFVVTKNLRL